MAVWPGGAGLPATAEPQDPASDPSNTGPERPGASGSSLMGQLAMSPLDRTPTNGWNIKEITIEAQDPKPAPRTNRNPVLSLLSGLRS